MHATLVTYDLGPDGWAALFTDQWIERVTAAIGAPPRFHHFEVTAHIDNVADLVAT